MQRQKDRTNSTQSCILGIPETLRLICYEKNTATLPVKLYPSLARYVKEHGGSTLIRKALIGYLSGQARLISTSTENTSEALLLSKDFEAPDKELGVQIDCEEAA